MSTLNSAKKRKGRPTIDSEAVNVRMARPMLNAIDAWITGYDPSMTRPEAVRRMIEIALLQQPGLQAIIAEMEQGTPEQRESAAVLRKMGDGRP